MTRADRFPVIARRLDLAGIESERIVAGELDYQCVMARLRDLFVVAQKSRLLPGATPELEPVA